MSEVLSHPDPSELTDDERAAGWEWVWTATLDKWCLAEIVRVLVRSTCQDSGGRVWIAQVPGDSLHEAVTVEATVHHPSLVVLQALAQHCDQRGRGVVSLDAPSTSREHVAVLIGKAHHERDVAEHKLRLVESAAVLIERLRAKGQSWAEIFETEGYGFSVEALGAWVTRRGRVVDEDDLEDVSLPAGDPLAAILARAHALIRPDQFTVREVPNDEGEGTLGRFDFGDNDNGWDFETVGEAEHFAIVANAVVDRRYRPLGVDVMFLVERLRAAQDVLSTFARIVRREGEPYDRSSPWGWLYGALVGFEDDRPEENPRHFATWDRNRERRMALRHLVSLVVDVPDPLQPVADLAKP